MLLTSPTGDKVSFVHSLPSPAFSPPRSHCFHCEMGAEASRHLLSLMLIPVQFSRWVIISVYLYLGSKKQMQALQ